MCGIVGMFTEETAQPVPEEGLAAAMRALHTRGPDAGNIWRGPGVTLGHRRLVVIDPEGSAQPLIDHLTGDALTYNGELYNYTELRHELKARGHRFFTTGDTEVVLRAWQEWGHDAWRRLNGMFALALYDARTDSLVLARDHAGIKPLYFARVRDQIIFASNWAALMAFPQVPRELNLRAVSHYLTSSRLTFGRETLLEAVETLEPAHALTLRRGRLHKAVPQRYWSLPTPADPPADAAEATRFALEHAIERQMVADVPLGGFLSGGLDSTILAAVAHRASQGAYRAYSVGYPENSRWSSYQEWAHVHTACDAIGMDCTDVYLRPDDFIPDWDHLITMKGMPVSTPNEMAIYRVAAALRETHTVALSGEGADEVFGGYGLPHFSAIDFARAEAGLGAAAPGFNFALQRHYGTTTFRSQADHYLRLNSWIPANWKQSLWANLRTGEAADAAVVAFYEGQLSTLSGLDPLDRYLHLHAQVNLEGLLQRLDSSTMAASVEGRVPFTDREVMEAAFRLPAHHKIGWRSAKAAQQGAAMAAADCLQRDFVTTKRVLREAFAEDVPASILERRKMSFPSPFREVACGSTGAMLREQLRSSPLVGQVFDRGAIDDLLAQANQPQTALTLWPLLNLTRWADRWNVSTPATDHPQALAS